jgi:hypothetical protein
MFSFTSDRPIRIARNAVDRKLCLIVAATLAVIATASSPIGAQQGPAANTLLSSTRAALFATIEGSALSSADTPMASTTIRLRDARLGRVVDTVSTDSRGAFEFRALEPGSYVVEMMGPANDTVVAATPIINVSSGQKVSAVLKLPFRLAPLGGILGHTLPSALAITSAAAAAGVLAKSVVGAPATDRALPGQ